jgi:hypothetical protein
MIAVIERSTAPQNAANTTSNASVSTSAAPKVVSWLFFGAPASVRPIILSIIINSFLSTVDQCYQSSKDRVLGANSIWVILVWLGRYLGAARCIGGLELRRMLLMGTRADVFRRCRTRRNPGTSVNRSIPEDRPSPPAMPCDHLQHTCARDEDLGH